MFPAIQPHARFNINNGSVFPRLVYNEIGNDDIVGGIKDVFNTTLVPAVVTNHLPKSIKKDIINNDKKIKEGSLIINNDIIYAKQYAINRAKRSNDLDLSCPIKQEKLITRIPKSKIIMNETTLNKAMEDNTYINKQDEFSRTALMAAVLKPKNSKEVSKLIKNGAELNYVDAEGNSALWLAIKNKEKRTTDVILKAEPEIVKEVNVDIAGAGALTPLMLAVIHEDVKLINKLASKKVKANVLNDDNNTAFTLAINNNASSLVFDALVNLNASVTAKGHGVLPPLLLAAGYRNTMVLDKILARKVDIDTPDDKGWTALMRAVPCRHYDMMQYLVNNGANVSFIGSQNITPLYLAMSRGDQRALDILLTHQADTGRKAIPDRQASLDPHTSDPKKTLKECKYLPDSGKPNTTVTGLDETPEDIGIIALPSVVPPNVLSITTRSSGNVSLNNSIYAVQYAMMNPPPTTESPVGSDATGLRQRWLPTTLAPALMMIFSTARQFISRQTRV